MLHARVPLLHRPMVGAPVAIPLAVWSFGYACYRAYYAAGGQVGMIGTPVSAAQFRMINAFGAAILVLAAILPLVATRVQPLRSATPVIGWIAAVGCCMHAMVDIVLRVLSVTGVHPTELPASVWISYDRHVADLQDLLLNEPWFFVEGLLWAAFTLGFVSNGRRSRWVLSAITACLLLTAFGVFTGLGAIDSFRVG